MRHGIKGKRFGRSSDQREALLSGLAKALFAHEQIVTTLAKAKDLRSYAEKLITYGKKGGLARRRALFSVLRDDVLAGKVMSVLTDRYKTRAGGYTRVLKCGFRQGDRAPMAVIELVDRDTSLKMTVSSHSKESTDAPAAAATPARV
ncbi:MAG: 50S ribosomal protein L17 [Holosporales bacterium]|jgi:large subunit ribosomal protein L17|nr:50S ribosomal protein L17 [Holosporales bacterium]